VERRSRRRAPKPEPVPPPKEWKIKKPWSEVQLSGSILVTVSLSGAIEGHTGNLPDPIDDDIDHLLADGVVAASVYQAVSVKA